MSQRASLLFFYRMERFICMVGTGEPPSRHHLRELDEANIRPRLRLGRERGELFGRFEQLHKMFIGDGDSGWICCFCSFTVFFFR